MFSEIIMHNPVTALFILSFPPHLTRPIAISTPFKGIKFGLIFTIPSQLVHHSKRYPHYDCGRRKPKDGVTGKENLITGTEKI